MISKLVPALVLGSLVGIPALARAQSEDGDHEQVVQLLVASLEAEDVDVDALAQRLSAIRPWPVAPCFRVFADTTIPSAWTEADDGDVDVRWPQLDALEACLKAAPFDELRSFFEVVAKEEGQPQRREAAIDLLGDLGGVQDLRLVMRLATPASEERQVLARKVREKLERTVVRILERDEGGLSILLDIFDEQHGGLHAAIVDAIVECPSTESLATLIGMLQRVPAVDSYLLSAISKEAAKQVQPVGEELKVPVRELLTRGNPDLVPSAARAAGRLEDYDAVPHLIGMLEDEDPNLRTTAHLALKDVTGLGFRNDPRLWESWYEREAMWWARKAPVVMRDLKSEDEVTVSNAISSVSRHILHRHQLAQALVVCLERDDPTLVKLACEGLEQLDSVTAVPDLIECLEHGDWSVRRAALAALGTITGRDLPGDPEAWRGL